MTIEKVYDELYGLIDDLKKQIAAKGGSDVTITPVLDSGTKIADFTIGEDEGALYTPTIPTIPDGVQYKVLYEDAAGFSGDNQSVTFSDYLENYDVAMALVNVYSGPETTDRYYTPLAGIFKSATRLRTESWIGALRHYRIIGEPENLTYTCSASSGGESNVYCRVYQIIGYKFNATEYVSPETTETRSKKKK